MKLRPGTRVLVHTKHARDDGGWWGTVEQRQGKNQYLVLPDNEKKRRQVHVSSISKVILRATIDQIETSIRITGGS